MRVAEVVSTERNTAPPELAEHRAKVVAVTRKEESDVRSDAETAPPSVEAEQEWKRREEKWTDIPEETLSAKTPPLPLRQVQWMS